ncbi:hypothetical protein EIP86_008613 [Pleurotus ostreatoroseus]|nr:hypothetical protein EIP86_008613 [Pleurotus ostreatoroseus]
MNYAPFSTPRTPKEYKCIPEPASPLARFNRPSESPEGLPSLRLWKEICKLDSESDNSMTSSLSSPSGSRGEMTMSANESTSQGSLSGLLQGPRKRRSIEVPQATAEHTTRRIRRHIRQAITKSGITKGRKRKNSTTGPKRSSGL